MFVNRDFAECLFCFDGALIVIFARVVRFLIIELGVLINKKEKKRKKRLIMDRIEWRKRIYVAHPDYRLLRIRSRPQSLGLRLVYCYYTIL